MDIIILASGSKGNAISISNNKTHILIDMGLSLSVVKTKLSSADITINKYEYLVLTHEHFDHIKGLKNLLKTSPQIKVFLTKGTYEGLANDVRELMMNFVFVKSKETFFIDNIAFTPFDISHDANEPVGFVIEEGQKKVVLATDTGYIDRFYFELLKNADLYILEANHDTNMLMNSQRPFHLKRRIISEKGHLSNQDASMLINGYIKEIDKTIWAVAHISEDCNSIHEIEKTIVKIIDDPTKLTVKYTSQNTLEKITL